MGRTLIMAAACALAFALCATGRAQDSTAPSQSLGDIARQAQKDKAGQSATAGKPAARILTNDDLPAGSGSMGSAIGAGAGSLGTTGSTTKSGAMAPSATSVAEQLGKLEGMLDQLESLDRATLVKNVLQGNDSDFPGRARWEQRLLAARDTFVSQGRTLLARLKEMQAQAGGLKGVQDPDDPRVKQMAARLQEIVRDATQTGASFQAVVMEGRDLAAQSSSH